VPFLADTGADRTVFSTDILTRLGLQSAQSEDHLEGVGGRAASVVVTTDIQLTFHNGSKGVFKGQFAAFTQPESLDMSVLGRDIPNLFALIVDRPKDVVCLLGQGHHYVIVAG
jgi:hypothetical protein